jgi:hypothetical protein
MWKLVFLLNSLPSIVVIYKDILRIGNEILFNLCNAKLSWLGQWLSL